MKRKINCKLWILFIVLFVTIQLKGIYTVYADKEDFVIKGDGTLTKYIGNDSIVTVPDTVKIIDHNAFSDCTGIKKVVLPEGLTQIGYDAFSGCSNLSDIALPLTLNKLDEAFTNCYNLKQITLPKSLRYLSWYNLDSDNGIETISIDPNNAYFTVIDGVIYNKKADTLIYYPRLKKEETYTIPADVIDISSIYSDGIFKNSHYLKHIIFNQNVTKIDGANFLADQLESITVPNENKYFCDINGVLFTKDKKELIAYPMKKVGKVYMIPEGTTKLRKNAFDKTAGSFMELNYIIAPNSITEIEETICEIVYEDDTGMNRDISLFAKKGSVVEQYARDHQIKFGVYNPDVKGSQLLLNASNLSMVPKDEFIVDAIFVPTNTGATIKWSSSNNSVASVDQNGKINAKKIGRVTINAKTNNKETVSITVIVKLPAPSNVKVKQINLYNFSISWEKVAGAKTYTVFCKSNQDEYRKIRTTTKTSIIDTRIKKSNIDYAYKVIANAEKSELNSEDSSYGYGLIPPIPKKLSVTQMSNQTIKITWEQMGDTNGYVIYRAMQKNGKYTEIATVEGVSEFCDTKVKQGTTYYYKIKGYYLPFDKYKFYGGVTIPVGIKIK